VFVDTLSLSLLRESIIQMPISLCPLSLYFISLSHSVSLSLSQNILHIHENPFHILEEYAKGAEIHPYISILTVQDFRTTHALKISYSYYYSCMQHKLKRQQPP